MGRWYANRILRAVFITVELTYFILTTRAVESLRCVKENGDWYLLAQPSLLCFSDGHNGAAVIGGMVRRRV